ncbi:MAG: hypothetical protein IPH00_01365 [Flavobacteriales bacterium]|nr:hypothetical protein [Flavobacteriales bacterium]
MTLWARIRSRRSFTRSIGTYVANGTGRRGELEAPFQGESFFETVGQLTGDNPAATSRIYRGADIIWAVAGLTFTSTCN